MSHAQSTTAKSTEDVQTVIKFSRDAVPLPVFGVLPPEVAVPSPKLVVPPPGNVFMVHTVFFGHLIPRKIINIVATKCQILRLNFTKFDFGWGSAQTPLWELTALPQTP